MVQQILGVEGRHASQKAMGRLTALGQDLSNAIDTNFIG